MPQSIFGTNDDARPDWRTDRLRRAFLSTLVGGLVAGAPLLYMLVSGRQGAWPPASKVLGVVSFWPALILGPLYDIVCPADLGGGCSSEAEVGLLIIAPLVISTAVYTLCAFWVLTRRARKSGQARALQPAPASDRGAGRPADSELTPHSFGR
jgi:hypothetical protein